MADLAITQQSVINTSNVQNNTQVTNGLQLVLPAIRQEGVYGAALMLQSINGCCRQPQVEDNSVHHEEPGQVVPLRYQEPEPEPVAPAPEPELAPEPVEVAVEPRPRPHRRTVRHHPSRRVHHSKPKCECKCPEPGKK